MNDVIIVAAGSGSRMKLNYNKQFALLNGKPMIAWTIEKYYNHENIDNIYLAIRPEDQDLMEKILNKYNLNRVNIVYGGKERQDSIYNCLKQMGKSDYILVHDGARPFVDKDIIDRSIKATKIHKATCVGVPSKDTIKRVDDSDIIKDTPNRQFLWCAQTPQSFEASLIKNAYEYAYENNISATDDASLVEAIGYKVKMVMGSYENIKITTPEDLAYGQYILNK
ncbi:2-C-methyl-D-erythritol 4-phosphate cytidylyltransferase [Peptostreptococcus equinus]|uniref:2-C-methyl-D-erythritol 4-phosphate cytidylyltransferase n=1 Tax=Peptostreptococcus equinus TaxID=3003601 RepID=A0ABY7JSD5_9FIRM|nr:2-C-methyl-D-erythritol 4-phosphate cytidylyltransferase [Peptostreptococcus sp. CBA3647]WAW14973.1 2-C-methyl-D-erythritol 4-phosphate cytidylyltransferase [Peptostreptococcus sp. CBA3647]